MPRDTRKIRNIGVIAHIDAGKTTVTERMLYFSGAKHRAGEVDKGTTTTDDDAEEQQRGITIYSACVTFPWRGVLINLIDTPGHVDFTAEVERSLRVLDGGIVVFSAREGVEAQSETVWRQADRYAVPRICFINKLDREGADFEAVFKEIGSRLHARPVAVQIPVGQGPAHVADPFRGVIDLVEMKMLTFSDEVGPQGVVTQDIPAEMADEAEAWREQMLETLYDYSNRLMELALQDEPVPPELIREVLREATLSQQIQPVFCGSALHFIGVRPLLDAVGHYLPSPLDRPPVEGLAPKPKGKEGLEPAARKPESSEPFCGLVFKVIPQKTGDMFWVRVYSGTLKANSRAYNPARDKKENIAQLWHIHATRKEPKGQIDAVEAGDIVCVIGPRFSVTGDTLCDAKHPIQLESIKFPDTVIAMAIEPENATERKKLAEVLDMLRRQDPTFSADENEETGQTLIRGMGELHLEVIKHRLLRDFKLDVKVHNPRVSYRETIARAAEVTGECHRQIAGQPLFAKVRLKVEPAADQTEVAVVNQAPPESLPAEFLPVILEELQAAVEGGGAINSFPLTKMRLTVLGGEAHEENSNETAFRIAASDAFDKALAEGEPVLLEPIMKLDLTTPEEFLGDLVGDLQQRRAIIVKTENRGGASQIEAHAPLEKLFGYSSAMRSLSQGRAGCSIEPLEYAPAPPETKEKFSI